MNYLIEGVNFQNKGAELMLFAIQQELQKWDASNSVSLNLRIGNFHQRNKANAKHLMWYESKKLPWLDSSLNILAGTLPQKTRESLNVSLKSDIDVVLDASGFCFSDQWGVQATRLKRQLFKFWKEKNKRIILLPQAFGPFTDTEIRKEFSQILDMADLVFARDQQSYDYIEDLAKSMANVEIAPDFTNLLKGENPSYADDLQGRPCIIPNARMMDKTTAEVKAKYMNLLVDCTNFLIKQGLRPFILIHETLDLNIAKQLQSKVKNDIPIVQEEDSRCLKGILSDCYLVIGSRFHGLISALSQGVPCLGTGWSHKYEMLFRDYDCAEFLFDVQGDTSDALGKLSLICDASQRESVVQKIQDSAKSQKELSVKMWQEVESALAT